MASPVSVVAEHELASGDLPRSSTTGVTILEAVPGNARLRWMEERLKETDGSGGRTWSVSCDFDSGGPWAGVNTFFESIFGEVERDRPDLIERHAPELVQVLPQFKRKLKVAFPSLTDQAEVKEKVRNYAADRAFRLVHGLIDLLDSWKTAVSPEARWTIACDEFDKAGKIGGHFFRELARRRGERLNIDLIVAVGPGKGEEIRASFSANTRAAIVKPEIQEEPKAEYDKGAAARTAAELEERIGEDFLEKQVQLAEMLRLWRLANRPDKLFRWKWFGLAHYLHLGLYEDALRCGDGLLELAAEQAPNDHQKRLWIIIKTLNGIMGMHDGEAGLRFAESVAWKELEDGSSREHVQLWFLVAMLYGRYRQPRELARGEEYLDRGMAVLEEAGLPEEDFHFEYVFNRNGVAMIRNFQRRHRDAIELCRSGIERLNKHLGEDKHRLHRSVLVYNIAQVYVAIGSYAEALEYYSAAMEMDPNYSEYYNERGNIYLRIGRLEEALTDYLKAVELSSPYFEVFTNLGQCYRRMGDMEKAVEAYSRALDLEPEQVLALAGRAKAHEELAQRDKAIADYNAALERDPKQWEALASRGVLHYETGNLNAALRDFSQAVELAPSQPGIYRNRAIVLTDLGRQTDAARDSERAAKLSQSDEQQQETEAALSTAS